MKKIHKVAICALFVGAVAGALIFVIRYGSLPYPIATVREATDSRMLAMSDDQAGQATASAADNPVRLDRKSDEAGKKQTLERSLATRGEISEDNDVSRVLASEEPLVANIGEAQGVDIRTSIHLMMGSEFDGFIERLSIESASSPLARDITDLYSRSAAEANAVVDNKLDVSMACGTVVCGLAATAPTKDTFDAWFKVFTESQSAPAYAAGRYDMLLDDGRVQYRMIFSTDPENTASIALPE